MSNVCPENLVERIKREAHRFKDAPNICAPDPEQRNVMAQEKNPPSVLRVSDFLSYHGEEFIERAYAGILCRLPDPTGARDYLDGLQSGRLTRLDVLALLRYSSEGRAKGIKVKGLLMPFIFRHRLGRLPIAGRCFRLMGLFRYLPYLLRSMDSLGSMLVAEDRRNLTTLLQTTEDLERRFREERTTLVQTTEDLEKRFVEVESRFHEHLTAGLRERDEKIHTLRRSLIEQQRRIRLMHRNQSSLPADAASNTTHEPVQESEPFFSLYADFEDAFRGLKEEVKEGLRVLLPFVQSLAASHRECRVLDLGCGRGEWLELLKHIGVKATGVDVNPVFIDELRESGLDGVSADAFSFLKESRPSSYTAVTAFHLIEHLPPASRIRLLDEIYRVLIPGGMAVLETPNPRNILVGSGDFYRDPSHINPVFPDTLAFIAEHLGFVDSVVYFFKDGRKGLIPSDEYRFDTLDDYIKVSRDYVWIGRKPS